MKAVLCSVDVGFFEFFVVGC